MRWLALEPAFRADARDGGSVNSTDLLALAASGVFLARLTPQPVRLARSGVAAGVSPLAALNSVTVAVAWIAHGLSAGLPAVWVVSVLALIPGIWAVVLLAPHIRPRDVVGAAAWVAAVVFAALFGVFGAALAVGVLVTQGPQVWRAIREDDLSGIAPATWWLSVLDALTWGAYGLAVGDGALVGYGWVLLASAVIVLTRVWSAKRPRSGPWSGSSLGQGQPPNPVRR